MIGRRLASGLRLVGLLSVGWLACATPRGDLVLQVSNQSPLSVRSIQMTRCDQPGWPGEELLSEDIRPRSSRRLALPRTCVNLVAVDSKGEIAGRQTNLKLVSESTWTLR